MIFYYGKIYSYHKYHNTFLNIYKETKIKFVIIER